MSIKCLYSIEKTNSFRPVPWHWSVNPFPAFRGEGARHRGFLAVGRGYAPDFLDAPGADGYSCATMGFDPTPTELIRTREKNTLLLVTCSPEQDEQIMLITLRGGFRGGYSRIEVRGGEILTRTSSNMHCCPTAHLIVRLTHPNGYVFAETGRRCSTGLVEVFSWDGYTTMPTQEFETWLSSQSPDLTDATKVDAKAKAEADREAAVVKVWEQQLAHEAKAHAEAQAEQARKASATRMKPILEQRLATLSARRQAIGLAPITMNELDYTVSSWSREYTQASVDQTEAEVVAQEIKAADKQAFEAGLEGLKPRIEACGVVFYDDRGTFVAREGEDGSNQYFHYTPDGLEKLRAFMEGIEERVAQAERLAQAKAERERQEAQAAATGLPMNVEIWKRRGGATNVGDGWVIQPDGMCRESDEMRCPRPRYPDEGTQVWRQILPGELVLRWVKAYTAAEHEFEVIYHPGSLTPRQLRTVALLQEELAQKWDGRSGMSGNTSSPPVGNGWGLVSELASQPPRSATLDDLKMKFGGGSTRRR